MTPTNALGVWTSEDCALVLIDYQKEMFQVIEWYFTAVPKVSKSISVHVREKANAAA